MKIVSQTCLVHSSKVICFPSQRSDVLRVRTIPLGDSVMHSYREILKISLLQELFFMKIPAFYLDEIFVRGKNRNLNIALKLVFPLTSQT